MIDTTTLTADATAMMADLPLNQTVTVQAQNETTSEWAAITGGTNVTANIEVREQREEDFTGHVRALTLYNVILAPITGLNEKCRLLFGSKVLNIRSVKKDYLTNKFLRIEAIENA